MKKLLVVSVLAATSTVASAFDYKINLEGRGDFVNRNMKTTSAGVTTTTKDNSFVSSLIRFNMVGVINDNLSYRLRYRFNGVPAAIARDATSDKLDYLYVDHKNSIFTTRFGKQNWAEAYGRESIVSGSDVFLTSLAATNFKAGIGDYRYGATAMFKFLDTNSLNLAVSNPNATATDATANTKNTAVAFGAYYTGSFAEKMLQPLLAYTLAPQDADADHATATSISKKGDYTIMSAGLRSEVAGFIVDADYKNFKKENRNSSTSTQFVKEETKSIYANVSYVVGAFTPIATYINDKFDSETNTADKKINSFAVGTYWKPMADVNFRYHAMFTSAQTKADGATSTVAKVDDKKIYFGFKADI